MTGEALPLKGRSKDRPSTWCFPMRAHAKSNCHRPHHRHSKGDRITEPQAASTRRHAVPRLRGSATVSCGNLQRRRSGTRATSGRNARAGQGHRRPTHRHGANGRRRCAELRGRGVVVPGSPDDAAGRRDTSSRSRRWCRCSAAPSGTLSRGAMPAWLERDSRANRTQHGQLHARLPRRVRGGRVESTTDCGHLCGTRQCLQGITPLPATPG